jgi:hypothetical protein
MEELKKVLIFRRAERGLLDATATTGGEPDGRDQLIHEDEYMPVGGKVQRAKYGQR